MKTRLLTTIAVLLAFTANLAAQYCGNSGPSLCTPSGNHVQGVLDYEQIDCIVRGSSTSETMQFKNFTSFTYNGIPINVDSLRFDSISNLPAGICWATNKTGNMFSSGENGCLTLSGITNAPPGQYKLNFWGTMFTSIGTIGPNLDFGSINIKLFVRVVSSGTSLCPPIDTNQTVPYVEGDGIENLVRITGRVYIDANGNNSYDNNETGLRNINVNVGSNTNALTNGSGIYNAYVDPGTYQVSASGIESGAINFPNGSISVAANTAGQVYANVNFAATISPSYCDAVLSVGSYGMPPRPGFNNTVTVSCLNNLSQNPISFTIRLYYDSVQAFINSSAAITGTGSGYLDWTVNNIAIGTTSSTQFEFNTPTTAQLGAILIYKAEVINSSCANLTSLTVTEHTVIVGSYDPNDKAVSPIGYSDHHGINPTQVEKLTYKIRFQNTGTFLAEKVVIVDTISANLDLTTLQVLSASHNYDVAIGDDRAVKFIFNQIMLPDSNSNEPESHGYVQYSIKLNPSLAQNTQVLNRADIYFDFNEPIRTNTAYNTIDFTTGIKEATPTYNFNLFPNPTTGSVQITADEQLVGKTLKVTDISGRVLLERIVETPVMTIQLSDFANGVYLLQIDGTTKKLVKE